MAKIKVTVPLDATSVGTVEKGHPLKVVARDVKGRTQSQIVRLDGSKGAATFTFDEKPVGLRVFVVPQDVEDKDVDKVQTVVANVSAQSLTKAEVTVPAITITPFYWDWWLRLCRTFTVKGRVVCPDGNPVPGARVCAYDVDWFWWWRSTQQVGNCVMTEADGSFKIEFKWCCGWWPWWWWRLRAWELDLSFYRRILETLPPELKVRRIPLPDPAPDLKVFSDLLRDRRFTAALQPITNLGPRAPLPPAAIEARALPIDLTAVEKLREPLLKAIPKIPETELLRPWPWWPWSPWYDCAPDLIFRVTQDCDAIGTVIVDETPAQVRWDIPTELNVTLTANSLACCTRPPRPGENCLDFTQVCDYDIQLIGAPDAPTTSPLGYYNPGHSDNPFGGLVKIFGSLETMTNAQYYEFVYEKATDGTGTSWGPETTIPFATAGVIARKYFDHTLSPPDWVGPVNFPPETVDGHTIYQSLRYYEALHPPNNWWDPHGRDWNLATVDLMLPWYTSSDLVGDGLYRLHVKGYDRAGDVLTEKEVFICNERRTPYVYLRIDNRVAEDAAHHMGPTHACGGDNVHYCVVEPDTDIVSVTNITTGKPLTACSKSEPISDTDRVEIVFFAYDPDGHLSSFDLWAHWGEGHQIDLIACGTLAPGDPGSDPPPPTTNQHAYHHVSDAQWKGGTYKLTIPGSCFHETCCYLLKLHAVKRTIVNCSGVHENYSELSFIVNKA